jgi:hypothetical protein
MFVNTPSPQQLTDLSQKSQADMAQGKIKRTLSAQEKLFPPKNDVIAPPSGGWQSEPIAV